MRMVGDRGVTQPRSRPAVLRGPGATRLRSLLHRCLHGRGKVRARTRTRDCPRGRPEAPTPHDTQVMDALAAGRPAHAGNKQNKQKHQSVARSLRKARCPSSLKYLKNSAAMTSYGSSYGNWGRMWVRKGGRMVYWRNDKRSGQSSP